MRRRRPPPARDRRASSGRRRATRRRRAPRALRTPPRRERASTGRRADRPPEGWLLKAYEDDILIDLIFDPSGVAIDDDLFARAEDMEVHAMRLKVAPLEDVITQKVLVLSEQRPDFSSVLELARSLREQVDWEEVRERTNNSAFGRAYFTLLEGLEIVTG